MASENYDDPRTISEECVGEVIVKELQRVRHVGTKCVSLTLFTGVGCREALELVLFNIQ